MATHYSDVIMGAMASQITILTIVYSAVYSGVDQTKFQSSASLAFVRGIHRWPVNSPHKVPVTRKMFPFDDVIMKKLDCNKRWRINKKGNHLCSSTVRARYRVSFVSPQAVLYPALNILPLSMMLRYDRPCYKVLPLESRAPSQYKGRLS